METKQPSRPGVVKALIGLQVFDAFGGFVGGVPLLLDPSGALLGVNRSMFPGLPVSDFLLIGLWLFAIYGVGSCVIAYLLWSRHPWAWPLALLESTVWLAWVLLEVVLWGPSGFIVPWLVPPVVAFLLLSRPTVRSYTHPPSPQSSS